MPAPPDPIRVALPPLEPPPEPRPRPPRRPRVKRRKGPRERAVLKAHLLAVGLVAFLAVLPATGALAAGAVASAYGCTLNESGSTPCVVGGRDIGDTLAPWGVAPWLLFVTVPAGALALAAVGVSGALLTSRARQDDQRRAAGHEVPDAQADRARSE